MFMQQIMCGLWLVWLVDFHPEGGKYSKHATGYCMGFNLLNSSNVTGENRAGFKISHRKLNLPQNSNIKLLALDTLLL